jgi:hypothetical protein
LSATPSATVSTIWTSNVRPRSREVASIRPLFATTGLPEASLCPPIQVTRTAPRLSVWILASPWKGMSGAGTTGEAKVRPPSSDDQTTVCI